MRLNRSEIKLDARLLVIDDDPGVLAYCARALQPMLSFVETAPDAGAGLALLATKPFDVVLTDLQMPKISGFDLIAEVRSRWPSAEIVVMTAYPGEDVIAKLLDLGISSMLVKPISLAQLSHTIMGACKLVELRRENERLRMETAEQPYGIVGNSPMIRDVISEVRRVASLDLPVLIEGESGTGKELVARGIHAGSKRSKGPFVAINCAAVSPSLIESELFGHTKGAFTDARADKMGLIEAADKGTLFLDEIGEMPPDLQPKLLRVLDNGEILRVGETKPRHTDVRVLAATNKDLQELTKAGRFREDLFFRIRGFRIVLPPLRERGADTVVLMEHFLRRYCPKDRKPLDLTPEARQALMGHSWPGNVRELQNLAAALYTSTSDNAIRAEEVLRLLGVKTPTIAPQMPLTYKDFKHTEMARLEAEYFKRLMLAFDGNVTKAAEAAGMHRANLRDKLSRYGLRASDYKG